MKDQREEDIQKLCQGVLNENIQSTGDYGSGGQCPHCLRQCAWNEERLALTKQTV